jgi:hypothetical protein
MVILSWSYGLGENIAIKEILTEINVKLKQYAPLEKAHVL